MAGHPGVIDVGHGLSALQIPAFSHVRTADLG